MQILKHILNIFFKNEYPKDIQTKFREWYLDSSHSDEKDEALKEIWNKIDISADSSTLDSLKEVERKLYGTGKRFTIRKYYKIAAAVILLPILSALSVYYLSDRTSADKPVQFAECFAPNGEYRTLMLPDSTKVTINSGSVVIYPEEDHSPEARYVYLNGEAYFEVTHRNDKPFIVKTDGIDVEVLGTKFNVSAYSDNPNIITTLQEGKVQLNFNKSELASIILNRNEQIVYNKISDNINKEIVKDEHIGAWKNGHLLFFSASIADIVRTFEHRYDVSIYINSNKYYSELITAKFVHGETLEESLQILKQIIPELNYKIKENKVYIY
ncbi:MAG: FecR domain-containing protein [Prevotella sp.]|jgi:ferric-dicitrate binding protein FerR (iron transport regulator)|nr:FecR domain-containing protein [Prevotella sp.]